MLTLVAAAAPLPARRPGPGWAPIIAAWQEADALLKLPRVVGADDDLSKPPASGQERSWLGRIKDRLTQQRDRAVAILREKKAAVDDAARSAMHAMRERAGLALQRVKVAASGAVAAAKVHAKDLASGFVALEKSVATAWATASGISTAVVLITLYLVFKDSGKD